MKQLKKPVSAFIWLIQDGSSHIFNSQDKLSVTQFLLALKSEKTDYFLIKKNL